MNREDAAAALMRDAQGFDPDGPEFVDGGSVGADDPMARAGLTTLEASILISNGVALALDLFAQKHADNVALPTGLTAIGNGSTLADYKEVLRYMATNPVEIKSMLLNTSEANNNAPLLSSMKLTPTRKNPFGSLQQNTRAVRTLQTTNDYQANRATVPLRVPIDTFTYITFSTDVNGSGADVTGTVSFLIGKRAEIRKNLGAGGRPVVPRPGGRGVAAV